MPDTLQDLSRAVHAFADERDWHRFHAPKNIASALAVEAAELLEPFQWLSEQQSRELTTEQRAAVEGEMADVLLYLVQLGNVLGIDPVAAAQAKLRLNAQRFPVPRVRDAASPTGSAGEG